MKHDDRVSFNIKCYPILNVIKNIRNVFKELHILLPPDEQHKQGFAFVPRIGFKNGKNLKDHLVGSALYKVEVTGNSGLCGGKRHSCELC